MKEEHELKSETGKQSTDDAPAGRELSEENDLKASPTVRVCVLSREGTVGAVHKTLPGVECSYSKMLARVRRGGYDH